jgi:hypothetical protein
MKGRERIVGSARYVRIKTLNAFTAEGEIEIIRDLQ